MTEHLVWNKMWGQFSFTKGNSFHSNWLQLSYRNIKIQVLTCLKKKKKIMYINLFLGGGGGGHQCSSIKNGYGAFLTKDKLQGTVKEFSTQD